MDVILLTIATSLGLLSCGFLLGRNYQRSDDEYVAQHAIASTIDNLVRDGYLMMETDEHGDPVILTVADVVKKTVDQVAKEK